MDGLFDLNSIFRRDEDDRFYEGSSEFDNRCPSSHPEVDTDTDATGYKEINVNVPGGYKESPSARPYDLSSISVPGGDSESPKSKPYDSASIPTPSKVTLTVDEYNRYRDQTIKSYKELAEITEKLLEAKITYDDPIALQEQYTDRMILESYEDGPLFEFVKRSDKKEIKEICKSIRKSIRAKLNKDGRRFYHVGQFVRVLSGAGISGIIKESLKIRLWQVLGILNIEEGNINEICKQLTREFEDELGEYKILPVQTKGSVVDYFINHLHWKNVRKPYLLLVDRKLDHELVDALSDEESVTSDKKTLEKESDDDKKSKK